MWLPEALADLERLYDFLIEKDPAAAARHAHH
jgi:plasmid stabilization system protein ParE